MIIYLNLKIATKSTKSINQSIKITWTDINNKTIAIRIRNK